MIKATFLTQLQQSIAMLDDEEQKDILDEYAQHIDMKVAGGMTEAEAIEDFGAFDDLVAEILSAYHVKAPVAAMPAQGTAKAAGALADLAEKAGAAGKAAGDAAGKAATATKNGMRKAADALAGGISKVTAKPHGAGATGAAVSQATDQGDAGFAPMGSGIADIEATSAVPTGEPLLKRLVSGIKRIAAWCWKTLKTMVRWAWNAAAACIAALFLALGLLCLAGTGFCLMLLLQGFPVIGASIAIFGATVSLLSAAYLATRLIVRKPSVSNDADAPSGNACGTAAPKSDAPFDSREGGTQPLPPVRPLCAAGHPHRGFDGMTAPLGRKMGAIHE